MSLFDELKRRNVIRVATAYAVAAWLVIQVVETIFPAFGFSDTAVRLLVMALAIAFIPVLVFSWVFEITPDGLKREVDVSREPSLVRSTGRKFDRFIMILLAVALGYLAFDRFVLEPARDAALVEETAQQARSDALVASYGDQSIAVLPFVNLSADAEQEYFSDGISEELLNKLAKIPELRVTSRSSAFSLKGKNITVPAAAELLNVAHVLEGSVRRAGNRVRITAQLIEARSDSHLWSESYDRELDDILALQEEIAAAISDALKVELMLADGDQVTTAPARVSNTDAYEAYLRGRDLIHRRGRDHLEEAVRELERALRLNEAYAPAHAQLAIATTLLIDDLNSYGTLSLEDVQRRAVPHLDRAEALDPGLAELHGGRALLALHMSDLEATVEHARKALAVNPSYFDAMNWLHIALGALGRYGEADAILKQIILWDPLNVSGRINYTGWLSRVGRLDEAREMADQLVVQSPEFGYLAHADIALIYEGKIAEGLAWALRASTDTLYATYAFIWVGEYQEARRIVGRQTYWIDFAEGRFDETIRMTQKEMQLAPDNPNAVFMAADALYESGRVVEALPLFERFLDFLPEGRPITQPLSEVRSIRLALARRMAGDEDGAQAAAQISRQDFAAQQAAGRKNQEHFLLEAFIAAFDHHTDHAIAALESAIQLGLRNPQVFADPIFEALRNEPRFLALQQEIDRILAVERDEVLQLICFHNPVPGNWQPLPGTCEGVSAR